MCVANMLRCSSATSSCSRRMSSSHCCRATVPAGRGHQRGVGGWEGRGMWGKRRRHMHPARVLQQCALPVPRHVHRCARIPQPDTTCTGETHLHPAPAAALLSAHTGRASPHSSPAGPAAPPAWRQAPPLGSPAGGCMPLSPPLPPAPQAPSQSAPHPQPLPQRRPPAALCPPGWQPAPAPRLAPPRRCPRLPASAPPVPLLLLPPCQPSLQSFFEQNPGGI